MINTEDFRLIQEWNQTEKEYPQKTIHQLFEEQVQKIPDNTAVIFDDQQLTYRELNEKSNQLAHYLRKLGIKPNDLVAICLERSFEMIIAILGILKAGGAYVPLDPDFPQKRLHFMLSDTRAKVLLTNINFIEKFDQFSGNIICFNNTNHIQNITEESITNPLNINKLKDFVYVVYTSGSTGNPKGVKIAQKNVINYAYWFSDSFHLNEDSIVDFSSHVAFDFSVTLTLLPLIFGARLVVGEEKIRLKIKDYLEYLNRYKITHVKYTPSNFKELLSVQKEIGAKLDYLKWVILGGEQLNKKDIQAWLKLNPTHQIVNEYGPTETTVAVTNYNIDLKEIDKYQNIPIGKPAYNTKIYILNGQLQIMVPGQLGEIYIAGKNVGSGYLNNIELTRQKFIPNPFSKDPNTYLYKTGDLGRWLPDGNLEFRGRIDNQVKIRGFRVELGEIEYYLNGYPSIKQAVVLTKERSTSEKYLVAYLYFSKKDFSLEKLQQYLQSVLPHYMIPSAFYRIKEIPLTANDKIDRKALKSGVYDQNLLKVEKYVKGTTPTEKHLISIWAEILDLDVKSIGINNDFFYLGGHSLVAMQLVSRIQRDYTLEISVQDIFDHPTISQLAKFIENRQISHLSTISPLKNQEFVPVSFAQEQIWLHEKMAPNVSLFNEVVNITMPHAVDREALTCALNYLIHRHTILGSRFIIKDGNLLQQIMPDQSVKLDYIDLSSEPQDQLETKAIELATQHAKPTFNLEKDSLVRFLLIQLEDKKFQIFATFHHLLIDAMSLFCIFKQELEQVYTCLIAQQPVSLPRLSAQYHDYAAWIRDQCDTKFEYDTNYWAKQLKNLSELQLPTTYTRKSYSKFRGKREIFRFPSYLMPALKRIAMREKVTYFMVLLTAFNILLHRYTNQDDIAVGSIVSGRDHPLLENLIGNFLNTIIFRNKIEDNLTFQKLLHRVKKVALEAYEHRFLPFQRLLGNLKLANQKKQPISAAFILEPKQNQSRLGWVMSQMEVHLDIVKFDLTFELDELEGQIIGRVKYNSDLFDQTYIQNMIGHFENLLKQIAQEDDKSINEYQLLNQQEQQLLLEDWNPISQKISQKTVNQLFEEQVKRTPNNIAIIFEDYQLTYQELNDKADRLANYLQGKGITVNTLVAICLERSVEMIIAILAVLKAGSAYIPIDPSYPKSRLKFILQDTQAKILLTTTSILDKFKITEYVSIALDQYFQRINSKKIEKILVKVKPDNLAQILYTSGTTGNPKGVMIEHRNLVDRLLTLQKIYDLDQQDTTLFYKTFCFDASVAEYLLPLTVGAKIVIVPENHEEDLISKLKTLIDRYKIHTIHFVSILLPFYLRAMEKGNSDKKITNLKRIISGGGKLELKTVKKIDKLFHNVKLFNLYGPTEATIDATVFECYSGVEEDYQTIPIGKPIANTQVYVLDKHLNPLPVYIPGELHIGGAGVARGYLNQPELTKEKFIPNPFSDDPKSRLYKTGDLVRWLPDGNLEFLGRIDHQVKIRGFRVELEEIEQTLLKHDQIQQAAVVLRTEDQEEPYLAAYLVLNNKTSNHNIHANVRKFLKDQIPDYMIPATFTILDRIPLISNGKLNRKALPEPDHVRDHLEIKYVVPKTKIQKQIRRIWSKVLKTKRIGLYDDFFELGGHSILAIKVIMAINHKFKIDLPVCEIFHNATIETLSQIVDNYWGQTPNLK